MPIQPSWLKYQNFDKYSTKPDFYVNSRFYRVSRVTKGSEGQKLCHASLWQFWHKLGHHGSKQVNSASAAYRRCIFYAKLTQIMLKYQATVRPLTKIGPCHTLTSQVTKFSFRQACHSVTWVMNWSKLYSKYTWGCEVVVITVLNTNCNCLFREIVKMCHSHKF